MAASMNEDLDLVDTDDYYAWLGLSKEASKEDINNAFRRLSRIYHPDKHAQDPAMLSKAETQFTKIKMAHEVLSDAHKRAIYDVMGLKGLETEGWEVVPRQKTPQEILEEYERLSREREERRLEQRTNPKGTISVGIDATEFFDVYESLDDYSPTIPQPELTNMSISQSVECPLTTKDTAVLSGTLQTQNGTGSGSITATMRRVTSHQGWMEAEVSAGGGAAISVRGFRTLWKRGFGTMAGTLQFTPKGLVPGLTTVVATQLDKNLQGRITWSAGRFSSMQTMVIWDTERHHLATAVQLGLRNTFLTVNYTLKFAEQKAKLRTVLRLGTFGLIFEYGADKKITQFSTVGASVLVGAPIGVTLKLKLNRGNQNYIFPVHLSDSIVPSAVFYGTVVPLVAYFVIKELIVAPFLKNQKGKDLQKKKEANMERLAKKKRDALTAVELMTQTVDRSIETEERKGGLVVKKAIYGKLHAEDVNEVECITVTRPLQAIVKDSKLYLPEGTTLSELPGFYDPCIGEEKELSITYEFRHKLHQSKFTEKQKILIPSREHLCTSVTESNPTASEGTSTESNPTAPEGTSTEGNPTASEQTSTESNPTASEGTSTEGNPTASEGTSTESNPTASEGTSAST